MFLLIFSALFVSALAQQLTIKDLIDAEKVCFPKFPPEVKALIHDLKVKRILPDNPSEDLKCFLVCMGKETGVIDDSGEFHTEKLKDLTKDALIGAEVTPEEIHSAVEECSKVQHDGLCDKVHMYLACKHDKFKHLDVHDDWKKSTQE